MLQQPFVVVILVNWNRPADTLECIRSLRESTYSNIRIIVVDNGSRDNSIELLKECGDAITLLPVGHNLGFTGGNNFGIQQALQQGADYIFLLNNDTIIAPDALEQLVKTAERDFTFAIVTPKICFYKPKECLWYAGAQFNPLYLSFRMVGYGEKDLGQFDVESDVPFVSGCAMLIRRSVVDQAGLLCDDFFAVFEDVDYSLRVRALGYRLHYQPMAVIWHKESMTAGGHDAPQYVYYQSRNVFILQRRWLKGGYNFIFSIAYYNLWFIKRSISFLIVGKVRNVLGLIIGVFDGIIQRSGRRDYPALRS